MIGFPPILVRSLVAAALALVVWSGSARAGCGEPMLTLGQSSAAPAHESPAPCHGSDCSSRPYEPPAAPAPVPTVSSPTDWAVTDDAELSLPRTVRIRAVLESLRSTATVDSVPFHPPRSA